MSTTNDGSVAPSRVDGLASWVEDLEARVDALEASNAELRADNERLRDRLDREQERREQLADDVRDQLAEFDRRTSLLARGDDADDWDNEQRAAHCIQKLYRRARSDDRMTVAADARTAWEDWFDCGFDRSSIYDVFRTAAQQTDGGVVTFREEPRGHDPPSRLQLDLDAGPLPESVGSTPVGRCEVSTTPNREAPAQNGRETAPTSKQTDT